jgi:coenzyme A diphosphatase NUDT7
MIYDKESLHSILPKQPFILGHEEAIHSVVLIPMVNIEGEVYILLEVSAPHIRQGSEISFPGGKVDATDAQYVDTAIRETVEELGIKEEQIEIIGQMDSIIGPNGIFVHCYLGMLNIKTLESCVYNKEEVSKIFLVPVNYLLDHEPLIHYIDVTHKWVSDKAVQNIEKEKFIEATTLPKKYHQPWSSGQRKVYIYQYEDEVIWGITASFLYDFSQKIKGLLD